MQLKSLKTKNRDTEFSGRSQLKKLIVREVQILVIQSRYNYFKRIKKFWRNLGEKRDDVILFEKGLVESEKRQKEL